MRNVLIACLLGLTIGSAQAQSGRQVAGPRPQFQVLQCADLALGPMVSGGTEFTFEITNRGYVDYVAPGMSKQWISVVLMAPEGERELGATFVPRSGGPVRLAPGQTWSGQAWHEFDQREYQYPVEVRLNFAPASQGWPGASDCDAANNRHQLYFIR